MKKIVLSLVCGAALSLLIVVGPVRGQGAPPPPPPPPATIAPPCPPTGCPTATPTPAPPTATPTNTPLPTPTSTPIPLFVRVKLAHKSLKAGAKQRISVSTLPAAHVTLQVQFPNHSKKHRGGKANSSGTFSWTFKQPAGVTNNHNHTAKVIVHVSTPGGGALKSIKKYTIK